VSSPADTDLNFELIAAYLAYLDATLPE